MPEGIALHKIIYNKLTRDFILLFELNRSFEQLFGLARKQVLRRKYSEIFSETQKGAVDWVNLLGEVDATSLPDAREAEDHPRNKYYRIEAYSIKKGYIVSIIADLTEFKRKTLQELEERKKE